jgi:hypothetical protein
MNHPAGVGSHSADEWVGDLVDFLALDAAVQVVDLSLGPPVILIASCTQEDA